ncbi:MAG: SH3 domain-containing protein [Spirochaetales bacterium]|nr:SH3 domain-containing protein [Spirochaetales bacterium]
MNAIKPILFVSIIVILMQGCAPKAARETSTTDDRTSADGEAGGMASGTCAVSGKITEDQVRVRNIPTLNAEIVGNLGLGEEVTVFCRTGERYEVYNLKDYWYLIKRKNGLAGWTYGHYISMEEGAPDRLPVHGVDYSDEIRPEDKRWAGEYGVFKIINRHKFPDSYITALRGSVIAIALEDEFVFSIGFHPDIGQKDVFIIKSQKKIEEFEWRYPEGDSGYRFNLGFVNNYVVLTGEHKTGNEVLTYEIYYTKKE